MRVGCLRGVFLLVRRLRGCAWGWLGLGDSGGFRVGWIWMNLAEFGGFGFGWVGFGGFGGFGICLTCCVSCGLI